MKRTKEEALNEVLGGVKEVVAAVNATMTLADFHKALRKSEAKKKSIEQKLKAQKAEIDAIETEILRLLAMQRENGLAPTAKMKDGTVYTEAHKHPWDGLDRSQVTAALIKLKMPEFLGAPLYGQMKSEWSETAAAPKGLRELLVVKDIPYLSVTKGS